MVKTTNSIIANAIYRADKAGVEHCMTIQELAPLIAEQMRLPMEEISIGEIEKELEHKYWLEQWM
jgi:hypothetical protein